MKRWKEAVVAFSGGIAVEGRSKNMHSLLFMNRGTCAFNLGKFSDASADYNQAIKFSPGYAQPYYSLGMLNLRTKRGIKSLTKAIEINSG